MTAKVSRAANLSSICMRPYRPPFRCGRIKPHAAALGHRRPSEVLVVGLLQCVRNGRQAVEALASGFGRFGLAQQRGEVVERLDAATERFKQRAAGLAERAAGLARRPRSIGALERTGAELVHGEQPPLSRPGSAVSGDAGASPGKRSAAWRSGSASASRHRRSTRPAPCMDRRGFARRAAHDGAGGMEDNEENRRGAGRLGVGARHGDLEREIAAADKQIRAAQPGLRRRRTAPRREIGQKPALPSYGAVCGRPGSSGAGPEWQSNMSGAGVESRGAVTPCSRARASGETRRPRRRLLWAGESRCAARRG